MLASLQMSLNRNIFCNKENINHYDGGKSSVTVLAGGRIFVGLHS